MQIALTDTAANKGKARSHFADGEIGSAYPAGSCTGQRTFRFMQVKYDYAQLEGWQHALMSSPIPSVKSIVLSAPRFRMTRIVTRYNRIEVFEDDSSSRAILGSRARELGIPDDAIAIFAGLEPSSLAVAGIVDSNARRATIFFEFQVDRPATMLPGEMDRIIKLQKTAVGVAGEAQVQFVVDSVGGTDMSTYKVLRASDGRLSLFLSQALRFVEYAPALKGDRRVPQLVQTRFVFDK